jgi:hypothetical protein
MKEGALGERGFMNGDLLERVVGAILSVYL